MIISEISSIENIKKFFPDILYKYRDWSDPYHKTIISNQEVFFSSPEKFDDKYDCRFPIDWDFSFENIRPYLDAYFPGDKSKILKKDYEIELINTHKSLLEDRIKQNLFIKNYYDFSNHHLGILSVTSRNDNLQIWKSSYAVDFKGFCVGINFKNCLQLLSDREIGGGIVKYVPDNYPKFRYVAPKVHPIEIVLELYLKYILNI